MQQILKGLNSQLKTLKNEEQLLCIQMSSLQRDLAQKRNSIKAIKNKISTFNSDCRPKVSEHALIRYFERVKGIKMEEIEKEILSDNVLKLLDTLGTSGTYPNGEMELVFKNGTVVTITTTSRQN